MGPVQIDRWLRRLKIAPSRQETRLVGTFVLRLGKSCSKVQGDLPIFNSVNRRVFHPSRLMVIYPMAEPEEQMRGGTGFAARLSDSAESYQRALARGCEHANPESRT
jgi:hypothetical protein